MTKDGLLKLFALIDATCRNAPEWEPPLEAIWAHKLVALTNQAGLDATDALTDDESWTPYPADILRKAAEQAREAQRHQPKRAAVSSCAACGTTGEIETTRVQNGQTYLAVLPCPNGCLKRAFSSGDIVYASRHSIVAAQVPGLAPVVGLRAIRKGPSQ